MSISDALIKRLVQNNVIIFIGAGLSMAAGLPNWKDLTIAILEGLGEREPKKDKYINALNDEILSPLEVLTKIEYLKNYAIECFEKEMLSHRSMNPTGVHKKVGNLSNRLITTNYDHLLETTYKDYEVITYSNAYKVAKLNQYDKFIFKLHGDINEPHKCILFPEQYHQLYTLEEKSPTFEFKKMVSEQSILFLGFGLNDPYINYILDYIRDLYSGFSPEHFIVTTEMHNWPDKITPIVIDDYKQLEPLIDVLIEKKQKGTVGILRSGNELVQEEEILVVPEVFELDSPPNNKYWVGRSKELSNIANDNFKVVFITGIGGQGKSALAAQFIRSNFDRSIYEFADWRDFKEEANRFQTKLISLIIRLSNGEINSKKLDNLQNKELVDTFFHYLGNRYVIFAFDNVDNYIDLEIFKPTGSLGYFFARALDGNHNAKFIFTCRPFIREASINFYQISLEGLSFEECVQLFELFNIGLNKESLRQLCQKAHDITKGHPLWLNLIAGQAVRGESTVSDFINRIENKTSFNEDDFSAILSEKILNEVWNSLNEKQKLLIRGIAETVKPETEKTLSAILESELNNNQFNKALRTLRNLNLVEIKSSSLKEEQIELHPLVKEFVLTKYPKTERAKFITLFVQYYDRFIYVLKPKLSSNFTINEFKNWTSKIELQINKGDLRAALTALEEVGNSLLNAGYVEEYVRVTEKLYNTLDWKESIDQEYAYFHSQLRNYSASLVRLGKARECEHVLEKYSEHIPGKSSHYLDYLSQKCYFHWFQEDYKSAIQFGEQGLFLLAESSIADNYELRHNLALAHRDSRETEHLQKALQYFLHNETLEAVLNKDTLNGDFGGSFYGNIGRCLEYMGNSEAAMYLYFVSLNLLLSNSEAAEEYLNLGYACHWISNIFLGAHKTKEGLYFLKYGIIFWNKTAPVKAKLLQSIWSKVIADKETKKAIDKLPIWKIENFCKEYLQKAVAIYKITSLKANN